MDHEIHINNGAKDARPIVFHLLPGEETIFNLKVINHGQPANISLAASSPLFKAVRLRKPDHHVVAEEIIPVLARMPADKSRLDGEIILSAGGRESRVPITLLRDSENPDRDDPGLQGNGDSREDIVYDEDGEGAEEHGDDGESEDESGRAGLDWGEDEEGVARTEGKQARRISFSSDADLQRYRSARSRGRRGLAAAHSDDGVGKDAEEERDFIPHYRTRIDDSFLDKGGRQERPGSDRLKAGLIAGNDEDGPEEWGIKKEMDDPAEEEGDKAVKPAGEWEQGPPGHEEAWLGYRQDADSESLEIIHQAERDELNLLEQGEHDAKEGYDNGEGRQDDAGKGSSSYALLERMSDLSLAGSIHAVPVLLLLTLIASLVLTFITGIIPEFPGALASSILMVTLIIYGASRLLKA